MKKMRFSSPRGRVDIVDGESDLFDTTGDSLLGSIDLASLGREVRAEMTEQADKRLNRLIDLRRSLLYNSTLDVSISSLPEDNFNVDTLEEEESFYGLPVGVKQLFEIHKGIRQLYQWQEKILGSQELKSRTNTIVILPTSGGKTLIAEMLILKEILVAKKDVLFILPYVSLVHEKVNALSPFALELAFLVEEYAGGKGKYPPNKRKKNVVYISTIEKADILINSLIEEERFSEIGLIVVDEFHLIGESRRGAVIEGILVKAMFKSNEQVGGNVHVVALSATLGNPQEMAGFLNGFIFTSDFRPVSLYEYVKIEDDVFKVSYDRDEPLKFFKKFKNKKNYPFINIDPDMIGYLVKEVVPDKSCLIFCPTKKNCENMCELVCKTLPKHLMEHNRKEKESLMRGLSSEGNGNVCSILRRSLRMGVAYHHSGLTASERKILEEAFLDNTLTCICCTSTLAAGVNLPAFRVILRSPYIGAQFLSFDRYKQMVGRAGRAGFGDTGESILLAKSTDSVNVRNLVTSKVGRCCSQLEGQALSRLILSSVSLKLVSNKDQLVDLMRSTLLYKQDMASTNVHDSILNDLITDGSMEVMEDGAIRLTDIGRAAVKGNIDIGVAKSLYNDLIDARRRLVLTTHLHLLYLIIPYDIDDFNLDHSTLTNTLLSLDPALIPAANVVGINESVIARIASGKKVKLEPLILKRFIGALVINRLLEGESLWNLSRSLNLTRGFLHTFLTVASSFASAVLRFCLVFPKEFWMFSKLLEEYPQKILYCCSQELVELMELPAVRLGRARQLYSAGFKDVASIAATEPETLSRSIDMLPRRQANLIVSSAKMLLLSKAELLQEEANNILASMNEDAST